MSARQNGHDREFGPEDREYSEQRRLESIHDAREDVIRVRNAVADPTAGVAPNDRATLLFQAVKSYVMELEPLFKQAEDVGDEYFTGTTLGSFKIAPPDAAVTKYEENVRAVAPGAGSPSAQTVEIGSLRGVLNTDPPLARTWTITLRDRGGSAEHKFGPDSDESAEGYDVTTSRVADGALMKFTYKREVEIPPQISNRAYRLCNEFLAEVGLDVELAELTDTEAELDYSDIEGGEFKR